MEKEPESDNVMEKAQGRQEKSKRAGCGGPLSPPPCPTSGATLVGKVCPVLSHLSLGKQRTQPELGERESLGLGYILSVCLTFEGTP